MLCYFILYMSINNEYSTIIVFIQNVIILGHTVQLFKVAQKISTVVSPVYTFFSYMYTILNLVKCETFLRKALAMVP